MAPVAIRTHRGHVSDTQLGGSGSASDLYLVYDDTPGVGISKAQIYSGLFMIAVGIPRLGDPHPELFSRLRVQSLSRRPAGNGWEVTVNYASASGSSNRQPIDPLAPFFTSIERTSRREDVTFPIFELRKITVGEGTDAAVEKLVWDISDQENTEYRNIGVFTAVVNGEFGDGFSLTVPEFLAIFPAIEQQVNKIHTFGGQKWRFVGPQRIAQESESTGEDPARWSVRYEWEQDPGIPNARGIAPVGGMIFQTLSVSLPLPVRAFVCQDAEFRLRPYTAFYTGGDPANPEAPPVAAFSPALVEDPDGWLDLPGIAG